MKKTYFIIIFLIGILTTSYGGNSIKIDPNLSSEETQAVNKTERSLPKGAKIESYEVVKSKLPLALLVDEYKSLRDQANKARIDYRTNITRGLPQVAQKNIETLQKIQDNIVEKSSNLESTSPQYIFVLSQVRERDRKDGKLTGFISIFDPNNLEMVDFIQITTPLYNNAVMVTEALDGSLTNPQQEDKDIKSSNSVVNFILQSNPK